MLKLMAVNSFGRFPSTSWPNPPLILSSFYRGQTAAALLIRGVNALANQAISSLWTAHSDEATLSRQSTATVEALIGIGPKDELEGMLAAQIIAAHNAAIECYRRAMIPEQTFQGRQQSLGHGSKLSARLPLSLRR